MATLSSVLMGHLIGHGMPVFRLIEGGLVPGKNFIQVVLRGYYPDEATFVWMRLACDLHNNMATFAEAGVSEG